MDHKMFCFQCEQTAGCAGCTGKAGVCGKTAEVAELQDQLTGALVGLSRAVDNAPDANEGTWRLMIEGLFTTVTNVSFNEKTIRTLIDQVHEEKARLVPGCSGCGSRCGRNDDYDMNLLWNAQEDIRSLKSLILFGVRGMAAYAHHAMMLGYADEEVNRFFAKALFAVGEDWDMDALLPIVMEVGEKNLKCMALLDKANTESYGIPYCPEASLWDKHKVKRLLENPRYTGKDGFPAAVDADTFQAARKKAEEKNALRQPRGGKSPIARLTPYFRCTCGGKLIRIGGKWLDSSELHLKCGSCGSTITTDTDTVLTEANRQIYAHEHPKQPAYAPSAEVIRLSNAINRGLEQPDSPEAVMALILQGAAARYDCCPEPISEYENFDHLPKADWNHFRRVVSYITITQEHIITVQFTDQAGKDE